MECGMRDELQYQPLLDEIVKGSLRILGANLTGIYLHGSMAMGCFQPDRSDIDLIFVVKGNITDGQKLLFMNRVVEWNGQAPEKGLELSVVKEEYCRSFLYPTPYELHFSNTHLQWFHDDPADYVSRMRGTDRDLAAHFTIIRKYGIVLYGEPVDALFGQVPEEDYLDSIRYDVEGAKEEVAKNPVYVILNLCRAAAFVRDREILSKKQGGEWALENLDACLGPLISGALGCYGEGSAFRPKEEEAQNFCDIMLRMIFP